MKAWLQIVTGLMAGSVGAIVTSRLGSKPGRDVAAATVSPADRPVIIIAPAGGSDWMHDAPSVTASPVVREETERPLPSPPTPEQAGIAHMTRHQQMIDQVHTEPTDRSWSSMASAAFHRELADEGVTVVDVDCRSTSCVATIEWPSFAAARHGFEAVLQKDYTTNCEREITLSTPADPEAHLRAEVVFTKCEGQ